MCPTPRERYPTRDPLRPSAGRANSSITRSDTLSSKNDFHCASKRMWASMGRPPLGAVGIPLEPEGIHSQFRSSPNRKRSAPVSRQGDATSRGPKSPAELHPCLLSFQTRRLPVIRSRAAETPPESSSLLPSSSPPFARQGARRRQHPFHPPHATCLVRARASVKLPRAPRHLRVARHGRDVAICSSAVIQLSMSTRESADSHFSARHPDSVKSQIA